MPKQLFQRWHGMHMVYALVLIFALTIVLAWYQWIWGLAGLILGVGVSLYAYRAERVFRKEMDEYVLTLSYRIRNVGNEVTSQFPFGILIYNEDKTVQWHNAYVAGIANKPSIVGESLAEHFPSLQYTLNGKDRDTEVEAEMDGRIYELVLRAQERVLYIQDITEHWNLKRRFDEDKLALGIVMMDNLEEVSQGMDEQQRAVMLSKVTGKINEWALKYGILLRRLSSDRYYAITNLKSLRQLEQSRFDLLDDVKEITMDLKIPMTLSIGMAAGGVDIVALGHIAQGSLDIALGRGGDQAVVKIDQRQSFYGGKSNAIEKRTRVRARVIAHALRDLMKESENIMIMGHKMPDMDSIGAAIGVLKAAQLYGKEAYIVLEAVNPAIQRMMDMLKEDNRLYSRFITPDLALELTNKRSLAIVVDTHRESLVAEPKLLQAPERIVIIDHHRRGDQFIDEAVLVYMEPYASSTCELVTELLQYIHDRVILDMREATALLAGITVDTKSFAMRTGSRTFEAASFLRRNGADSALIQRMLKEDLEEYLRKAEIIRHAEIYKDTIALAAAEQGKQVPQLLIAQAADTLLNMTGIRASFVIGQRSDGLIGISARSLGQVNVQIVMERLGGGGHFTNAAAQLQGTVTEVIQKLKQVIKELEEEEGLFE